MSIRRMDHVGIVVEDLDAAVDFFVALGLEVQGGPSIVEGAWVEKIIGLDGPRAELVMVSTPDRRGSLELTRFLAPLDGGGDGAAPANRAGIRHICFAVDDLDATLAALRMRGADLVGEVVQYESAFRLCYVRGPEGIIVELAEELSA